MTDRGASPLISILMPVKNEEQFLNECLDSIIGQTYLNWELLAVDDGSSDSSFAILRSYSKRDQRIKCYRNDGKGIIKALRLSYSHSGGNFITRMDADDVMSQDKLHELSQLLITHGRGHIATGLVKYFCESKLGGGYVAYEKWLNRLSKIGNHYSEIYKECPIPSPCWMLHKSDLEKIQAFNPYTYPEDYDLVFRCYQAGYRTVSSQDVIHYWRDHSGRTSRTDENYSDNSFIHLKLKYFFQIDKEQNQKLYLIGAGTRGKKIASRLIEMHKSFIWISNNKNKIGRDIYGQIIETYSKEIITSSAQYLVSVANKKEQQEIISLFQSKGLQDNVNYYLFC